MRSRMIRILLTIVVLTQSVASLAMVPAVSDLPAEPASLSAHVELPDEFTPRSCHDELAAPRTACVQCCDTMDEASCLLNCSSVASVISLAISMGFPDIHEYFPMDSGHAAPHNSFSGLYRPPRVS